MSQFVRITHDAIHHHAIMRDDFFFV